MIPISKPPIAATGGRRQLWLVGAVAIGITCLVAALLHFLAHFYMLNQAEKSVKSLLLAQRGFHRYIQEVMHPTFYKLKGEGQVTEAFYAPEILSSSFIVRNQHAKYNEERKTAGLDEIYYKMAAFNPRNPVNQATPLEADLIRRFNADRSLKEYREELLIDGRDYLFVAIPFLDNQKKCMKCHGKRQDAPPGLQRLYPGEGGFNEKLGDIRAIESIRIPLQQHYSALHIVLAAVLVGMLSLATLLFLNTRLRNLVTDRTRDLEMEVAERRRMEEEVRAVNQTLEERVDKRTSQLAVANRELDAFAYSVSHDLRAPLRGIDGFTLALLEDYGDKLDETGRDYISRVRGGCRRMGDLIDDMLKLSRLSRGELRLHEVDLSAMAAEIVEELRRAEPARQVAVEVTPGVRVRGDGVLLRAVLENLLSNAWKFTAGTASPAILVGTRLDGDRQVYFVQDNGAGFDMAYADKLFGAFQRLHTEQEFAGNGIGLATVQRIIHRHGGTVWAEGVMGKGATFSFTL
ncbi:MAG: hypothetical protein A2512_07020 [Deltaproteobacteria bacterium RIFOXYD12_FULL_56_24]|nr:MAG: hypothetical protein A2512_07020 [Deltaproteobacteria bacterium RIFOXYD12_FULL_56_24]